MCMSPKKNTAEAIYKGDFTELLDDNIRIISNIMRIQNGEIILKHPKMCFSLF